MAKKKNKLWFKNKTYGWGWTPSSIEGWLVLGTYLGYVIYRTTAVDAMFDTRSSEALRLFFELTPPTIILLVICYLKGEKPKWQWGNK